MTATALALPQTPQLRWYQQAAVDAFFQHVATGTGNTIIVLPTGSGKSLTISAIIQRARRNSPTFRVCVLAGQAELVKQNAAAVALLNDKRDVGIFSASVGIKDLSRPFTVANIQSIEKAAYKQPFDLLIIDEADTISDSESGLFRRFYAAQKVMNPDVIVLGTTATPFKLSSGSLTEGKGALFSSVCYEAPVLQLIEEGYLCRPIIKRTSFSIDASDVHIRGGEFVAKELAEAVDVEAVTAKICDDMVLRFADRNRWLVFAVSIEHAQHLGEQLEARGIPTCVVHGNLSRDERTYRLHAFATGEVRAAVNCELLTVGYDLPTIDALALCRPTNSPRLYVQMIGRGMRVHPSKTDCLVADYAQNAERHGPLDAVRIRSKNRSDKDKDEDKQPPVKLCPVCETFINPALRNCPECNHEFPPPAIVLTPRASTAPLLSTDIEPEWHDVTHVVYMRQPANEKKGKTIDTLRVQYKHGMLNVAADFVCLEHEGFARRKAEEWWARRSPEPCPRSIADALAPTDNKGNVVADDLRAPSAIALLPQSDNPQWKKIVQYRFPDDPSCRNCAHFTAPVCQHYHDTVPTDAAEYTGTVRCLAWQSLSPF